uniref:hypothetical protein n=1 Tax=Gemmiger formicilis TaxID=745368 RepID=UPI0040252513
SCWIFSPPCGRILSSETLWNFCDRVIYVFAFCILLIILVGNAAVTAHVSYDEAEINCLQRCTAAENFTLQEEILFESWMVECKAIRLIQKTPKGFPRGEAVREAD